MVPGRALALGVDTLVTCLARFVHTSALIREKYPNAIPTMRFTNLKVLTLEKKIVSRSLQDCVVFLSLSFPHVELHLVQRHCKVTQEGPREHIFGFEDKVGVIEEAEVHKSTEMVKKTERMGVLRDGDVIEVRSEGEISIDNDNLLVPENLPVLEAVAQDIFSGKFDHNGL